MNRLIIASAAAALMLGISAPAFAQATAADCQTLFQRADVNKDGSLQANEAKIFIHAMNKAKVKPKDASLVKEDEFLAACQKNAFVNIDPATIGTASTEQPAASATQTTEQAQTGTTATTQQQTVETQPATTEQTTEQALAAPQGFFASNLIGTAVYSQDDQSIGDINDIILSPQGQASHVVVGVGGFLGMGEKDVVLDISKLKIAALENGKLKIVVQTTPEELKSMPAFKKQK